MKTNDGSGVAARSRKKRRYFSLATPSGTENLLHQI